MQLWSLDRTQSRDKRSLKGKFLVSEKSVVQWNFFLSTGFFSQDGLHLTRSYHQVYEAGTLNVSLKAVGILQAQYQWAIF